MMDRMTCRWAWAMALLLMLGMASQVQAQASKAPGPDAVVHVAQAKAVDDPPAPAQGTPVGPNLSDTNAERARTQPGNNAPMWRAVRESGTQPGTTSLPGAEMGVLIQSFVQYPGSAYTTAGEAWRQVRNQLIIPYGAAVLLIAVLALCLFYAARGTMGKADGQGPRKIERFTYFERAAHWTNAIAFVTLAVSGIVMAFGQFFLLPVLGGTLFGWLTYALKTIHNFVGPLFVVSLLVVFFTFVRDNLPSKDDLGWLAKGGGMFTGAHVPSHRFNAGEKIVFWAGVFLLGFIVAASGLVLDKVVPGMVYTRGEMQIAHMIHAGAAMLMMALFIGHIYMGTVGVKGAFRAMKTGQVDEDWAREHHEHWYRDIQTGKIPAQRSATTGGAAPGAAQPRRA